MQGLQAEQPQRLWSSNVLEDPNNAGSIPFSLQLVRSRLWWERGRGKLVSSMASPRHDLRQVNDYSV